MQVKNDSAEILSVPSTEYYTHTTAAPTRCGDNYCLFASAVFTLSVFRYPDFPQPCGAVYLR